jgi:CRP-like cAMP-binding protein
MNDIELETEAPPNNNRTQSFPEFNHTERDEGLTIELGDGKKKTSNRIQPACGEPGGQNPLISVLDSPQLVGNKKASVHRINLSGVQSQSGSKMLKSIRKSSTSVAPAGQIPAATGNQVAPTTNAADDHLYMPEWSESPAEAFAAATGYQSQIGGKRPIGHVNVNMAAGGVPQGGRTSPANQMNMVHRPSTLGIATSGRRQSSVGKMLHRLSYMQGPMGERLMRNARRISAGHQVINKARVTNMNGVELLGGIEEDAAGATSMHGADEAEPLWKEGSMKRFLWSFMCFVVAGYYLWIIPYRICVMSRTSEKVIALESEFALWLVLDYLADLFFWVDIVVRMKFMYAHSSHYMGSALLIDVVSLLPIDVVMGLSGTNHLEYFRLNRLLKALKIGAYFTGIEEWFEAKDVMTSSAVRRMIRLYITFAFLTHFHGCAWFVVSALDAEKGLVSWALLDNVLLLENEDECCVQCAGVMDEDVCYASCIPCKLGMPVGVTHWTQYLRAWYWAVITMVTTGFGDIVPNSFNETVVCIASMYVGLVMAAAVIANMTNLVANLDQGEAEFQEKMDNLNKYMSYRHLPQSLQSKIRHYCEYMYQQLRGVDEDEFLRELPVVLMQQVQGLMTRDFVMGVPYFRDRNPAFINSIIFSLEQIVVSPGDNILTLRQPIHGIYFLTRGEAERMAANNNTVVARLSASQGHSLGESSLFFSETASNTVRAKTYCELYTLTKDKFEKVCRQHISAEDVAKMRDQADNLKKRQEKVKKFFGAGLEEEKKPKGFIKFLMPDAMARKVWVPLIFIGVIYTSFMVPFDFAFYKDSNDRTIVLHVLNYVWDLIFLFDFILKSNFFPYMEEGVTVMDRRKIRTRYASRRGEMFADVMSCLPFDFFALAAPGLNLIPFLRINKACRLYHINGYFKKCESIGAEYKFLLTNAVRRLVKIFFAVLLSVHWLGSFWLFMGKWSAGHCFLWLHGDEGYAAVDDIDQCHSDNWIKEDSDNTYNLINTDGDSGAAIQYLRSVYWAIIACTTVGYGDIVPQNLSETVYALVCVFFGGLAYPSIVGAMAVLMGNLNKARSNFQRKIVTLRRYMEFKKFPHELCDRITRYNDYLWSRQRGVDEAVMLEGLPGPLRMEAAQFINGSIIESIPFFAECEKELKRSLLTVLKPAVFLPLDILIHAGESGREMYLLERGAVRVTSPDGSVTYAVLTKGDYFGEACLLKTEVRTASIIAMGYCDCFVLSRDDFVYVLEDYPHCREPLMIGLQKTLDQKKNANAKVMANFKNYTKLNQTTSMEAETSMKVPISSIRHPDSYKRQWWSIWCLAILLYNCLIIPFRIAYSTRETTPVEFVLDFVLDLFFIADIVLADNYFGYMYEGKTFTDNDDISEYYRSSPVYRKDIIASVPYDLVGVVVYLASASDNVLILSMAVLRIPKLIRVVHIGGYVDHLDRTVDRLRLNEAFVKLIKLVVAVFMVSHWFACMFFTLARYARDGEDPGPECDRLYADTTMVTNITSGDLWNDINLGSDVLIEQPLQGYPLSDFPSEPYWGMGLNTFCRYEGTWIQQQFADELIFPVEIGGELPGMFYRGADGLPVIDAFTMYVRSINWSLPTLVVVVIGDALPLTTLETFYVFMAIVLGITVNAAVIGNIGNLVANLEGAAAVFRQKMDDLDMYMHIHNISPELQDRARKYLEYFDRTTRGFDEVHILADLPSTLRVDVSNFLKMQFVQLCPFFEFCDPAIIKALAYSLKKQMYSPNDWIVQEGDLGREMFFIETGMIEMIIVTDDDKEIGAMLPSNAVDQNVVVANGKKKDQSQRRSFLKKAATVSAALGSSGRSNSGRMSDSGRRASGFSQPEDQSKFTLVCTLTAGSFFGESGLFFQDRRTSSFRACDYCELFVLEKTDLDSALSKFPYEQERMFKAVSEFQELNNLRQAGIQKNFAKKDSQKNSKLNRFIDNWTNYSEEVGDVGRWRVAIFTPLSAFRGTWDIVSTMIIFFLIVWVPFDISFQVDALFYDFNYMFFAIEWWFVIDVFIRLTQLPHMVDGKLKWAGGWKLYVKSFVFLVDLMSALPITTVFSVVGTAHTQKDLLRYLRLLQFLRIYRLGDHIVNVENFLQACQIRVNAGAVQVVKCVTGTLMVNHWSASMWFYLHRVVETDQRLTWAIQDNLAHFDEDTKTHSGRDKSIIYCYVRGFHFVITALSTVGYGDIRPYGNIETIFQVLIILTAACLFAGTIGSIGVYFDHSDSTGRTAFKSRMGKLKEYMRYRSLPQRLQESIIVHFEALWERQKGIDSVKVLRELSVPLRLDIAVQVNNDVLSNVKVLKACPFHIQRHLALNLRPHACLDQDFVYRVGDLGFEIYFITSGKLIVLTSKNKVKRNLRNGDHFGTPSVRVNPPQSASRTESVAKLDQQSFAFNGGVRTETIQAVSKCTFFTLHTKELENVARAYPECAELVRACIFTLLLGTPLFLPLSNRTALLHVCMYPDPRFPYLFVALCL